MNIIYIAVMPLKYMYLSNIHHHSSVAVFYFDYISLTKFQIVYTYYIVLSININVSQNDCGL